MGDAIKSGAEYVKESAENAGTYIKETYNSMTGQETATDKIKKNANEADKEMGKKVDEAKKEGKDLKENVKDKAHEANKEMGKKIDEMKK